MMNKSKSIQADDGITFENPPDYYEDDLLLKKIKETENGIEDGLILEDEDDGIVKTGDELSAQVNPDGKVFRHIFFVVMPVFCGYATLFSLQGSLYDAIYPDASTETTLFGFATSMLYVGNLIFRLGHNFVFGWASSRMRTVIAMCSMALSMWTIFCVFVWFRDPTWIWMVFVGYGFGGVAIGTFESNVLSMITSLGHETKLWAIIAIPVGINTITIGAFILLGFSEVLSDNPEIIHFCVMTYCIIGLLVLFIFFYDICDTTTTFTIKEFILSFREWKEWIWKIKWNCAAMVFDMFCVSLFSPGVILFIYSGVCIEFTISGFVVNKFWFVALYNTFFFIGDTSSRKIFYNQEFLQPFAFLLFSAAGIFLGLIDITILVPLTALGVSFGNGGLYTQTNRRIDKEIDEKYNLSSLSFWLFIGDIGSVIGSNLISFISTWITEIYHSSSYVAASSCGFDLI